MAYCEKCGTKLEENERFCPECGAAVEEEAQVVKPQGAGPQARKPQPEKSQAVKYSVSDKAVPTDNEIQNGKVMAVLSYLSILVLIPWFVEKENRYVRFHAKQGMLLFMSQVILGIFTCISSMILMNISIELWVLLSLVLGCVNCVLGILAIVGIVYAVKGQMKELPIIGKIKILK